MTTAHNPEVKNNPWRTFGLLLIGLFIGYIIGRFELTTITFENDDENIKPAANEEVMQEETDEKTVTTTTSDKIYIDGEPYIGSLEAPVIIVDFSDYECPFCYKFYTEMYPKFKEDYIDTGKVLYISKDFPLNIHPKAQYAHYAAQCAREQDKFWEMHKLLFEKQSEWTESEDMTETFVGFGREIGLYETTFRDCMTSEKPLEEIMQDRQEGLDLGIKGTPTLFINGKIVRGVSSYEQFKQLIEKAL